jgi:hypothetical protein
VAVPIGDRAEKVEPTVHMGGSSVHLLLPTSFGHSRPR